jgi:hypothetical protein
LRLKLVIPRRLFFAALSAAVSWALAPDAGAPHQHLRAETWPAGWLAAIERGAHLPGIESLLAVRQSPERKPPELPASIEF